MGIKDVFKSWDFIGAVILALILCCILPSNISQSFARDMISIAISVLSIIFAVFFAALAIIITSGEDDFIRLLEENNDYTGIIQTFKYTLAVIFISLVFCIAYYGITSYTLILGTTNQSKYLFTTFSLLFIYALFCAFNASFDAITYSKYRAKYFQIKNTKPK